MDIRRTLSGELSRANDRIVRPSSAAARAPHLQLACQLQLERSIEHYEFELQVASEARDDLIKTHEQRQRSMQDALTALRVEKVSILV